MTPTFKKVNPEQLTEKELLQVLNYNQDVGKYLKKEMKLTEKVEPLSTPTLIEENKKVPQPEREMDDFENEVDFHWSLLSSITEPISKEEMLHHLPTSGKENYEKLLYRLKLEVIKIIRECNDMLIEAKEYKILEGFAFATKEIKIEEQKLEAINDLLNSPTKSEEQENKPVTNKVVFVPNTSGTIRFLEEIDSIPQELYPSVNSLFQSIKDGTFKKVKRFTSNNSKIAGISEVRDIDTGARIVFDQVGDDTYALLTVFIKKVNLSHGYHEQLERKIGNYKARKTEIKEELKNNEYQEQQAAYEKEVCKKLETSNKKERGKVKCKQKSSRK